MKYLLAFFLLTSSISLFAEPLEQTTSAKGAIYARVWSKRSPYHRSEARVAQIQSKLSYTSWGEGKVRGQITFKGVRKCKRDKFVPFIGIDRGLGEIEIFHNIKDLTEEKNALGSIVDYGDRLQIDLSGYGSDLVLREETCSLTITTNTSIILKKE